MKKNKVARLELTLAIVFLVAFIVFTVALCFVDVQPIGPQNSKVGMAAVNSFVRDKLGTSNMWVTVTKLLGYASLGCAGAFGVYTLLQLIKKRSIIKVNPRLWVLMIFFAILLCLYVVFDKVIVINRRPILEDGVLEPSYPSSHTLLTVSIMGMCASVLPHIWHSRAAKPLGGSIEVILICVMAVGRLLSGVHWFTDIVGACLLSGALIEFYKYTSRVVTEKVRAKLRKRSGGGHHHHRHYEDEID